MKPVPSASPAAGKEKQAAMTWSAAIEITAFLLNLAGALLANSLTLWTNTLRIGLDTLATLFAFYVIRRITSGRSANFDYGLGKWENFSALISATGMIGALVFIAAKTSQHLLHPQPITGTSFGFAILLFFTGMNFWLLLRFWRLRRRDSSPVVDAQFVVYRNGSVASIVALLAVAGTMLSPNVRLDGYFDLVGTTVVALVIFYGMISLFRHSLSSLLDQALEESLQIEIMRGLAESFRDYVQLHRIRSRRAGDRIFIEIFLEFDPTLSLGEMLDRSSRLKARVESLVANSEAWIVPSPPSGP